MMVDAGAAPKPYEAESWANRNRTVYGSANYEPPLWEYRANAPRPVTLVNVDQGVEQAIIPGATWDGNQLNFMLGRTVNEATSFRFLHSYLYELQPATRQYWFSDNVWYDAKAELLFRGGPCYTTVPAINVVAEKHYAWSLPIAAVIATNRNGVPWGYLGSVNDVLKSPSSDRDQSMAFAHPEVSGGAFTDTAIHEASHCRRRQLGCAGRRSTTPRGRRRCSPSSTS